jgi:hypothetical protein
MLYNLADRQQHHGLYVSPFKSSKPGYVNGVVFEGIT